MRKYRNAIVGLGVGAVGLSIGSQVLGGIGGDIARKGQAGFYNVSKFAPAMGTIIGSGLVVSSLKGLERTVKKGMRK